MAKPVQNLRGHTFGKLLVIDYAGKTYRHMWKCLCACGKEKVICGSNLSRRKTTSCGCVQKSRTSVANLKHGASHSGDITYASWKSMNRRCTNPNTMLFSQWGGRGITVCDRWKTSFEHFVLDLGPRPSPSHSIDRIDNDKGYFPGNCRWATKTEQARNTKRNRLIEYNGETKCLAEWADIFGIKSSVIKDRIFRYNWPIDRAFTEPVAATHRN